MCGIAGQLGGCLRQGLEQSMWQMANTLHHRGPDDGGVWVDEAAGIALGHRRLSILDLSPAGHQPMLSISGRYVIVFNGEIYNHMELRLDLEKIPPGLHSSKENIVWRGHSDTETLLAGFETWGIEATLKKTVGMFAIALWDREEKVLTLARDRMGEKPLYYGWQGDTFLFGSELKALKVHPDFLAEIDRDVICLYLRHCAIPAPYSIYKGIKKLLPGTYLQLSLGRDVDNLRALNPKNYWCLAEVVAQGAAAPFVESDMDAIAVLDSQLKQSVGLQMMADVPLGAFLSGGVDSSTVVALMQAQSIRRVKTFSIGFDEQEYSEANYAKAVAQHLGTEHTELYVSSAEAMQVIPMLGRIFDEPFADSSQIPTFLVSQMARQHVTVSLSGDAGDELFCGYNRYALADIWGRIEKVPFGVRRMAGQLVKSIAPSIWDVFLKRVANCVTLPVNMSEKLEKLATQLVSVNDVNELYYSLVSKIDNSEQVVMGAKEPATWLTEIGMKSSFNDPKLHMMFMDAMTYLPDDILVKVDRAAMANSLETRVPLLDHRVIEMAWALPMAMKVRDGKSKWILRQVLYQYVPEKLIERPKAGFAIPLGDWLRGPLRDWVEALLDETRLQQEGFFNAKHIRAAWQAHLKGKRNNSTFLWNILMFQVWLEENR
ncbi:MAG: asparagine synthase (glutamine-hydrolyzing) [Nitrosomonas sp.]|nr:asparagine synthase (glutamine-hydrolyzing) [Nitrosomonas sp.]